MNEPTREELIELCDRGLVPQERWWDRDSAKAQRQLAECGALLRAGCDFRLATRPVSTDRTWWVEVEFKGFDWFEIHLMSTELYYLPTAERLAERTGGDWY